MRSHLKSLLVNYRFINLKEKMDPIFLLLLLIAAAYFFAKLKKLEGWLDWYQDRKKNKKK